MGIDMAMHRIQICKRTIHFQKGKFSQVKKKTLSKNIGQTLEVFHSYVYAITYILSCSFVFIWEILKHGKNKSLKKKKRDKNFKSNINFLFTQCEKRWAVTLPQQCTAFQYNKSSIGNKFQSHKQFINTAYKLRAEKKVWPS